MHALLSLLHGISLVRQLYLIFSYIYINTLFPILIAPASMCARVRTRAMHLTEQAESYIIIHAHTQIQIFDLWIVPT